MTKKTQSLSTSKSVNEKVTNSSVPETNCQLFDSQRRDVGRDSKHQKYNTITFRALHNINFILRRLNI